MVFLRTSLSNKILGSICLVFLCSCTKAETKSQQISPDTVNLSAKVFLGEFVSQNEESRKAARLYLLGVLEATEGKTWCDYKKFSTATLNEFIFEYLKKRSPLELEQRASTIIEASLNASFPCKGKK